MTNEPLDRELRTVALDSLHHELGARMVPFAGYSMPVQYLSGIIAEHKQTRTRAGLFDISHMGQVRISGPDVAKALEKLVPGNLVDLPPFKQRYTVFTTASGGVFDDFMVTNIGDHFFLVVNAARKDEDLRYLKERMLENCTIELLSDQALIALQGPQASGVLARLAPGSEQLKFMTAGYFVLDSLDCLITRCGYTGEDGFEISVPALQADRVARLLLNQPEVNPIGLGARDSLRLEAGLSLYGHELDESTTLIEAGLQWVVAKRYQGISKMDACFPGAEITLGQIRDGVAKKRVGLIPEGRAPIREGTQILNFKDEVVGRVTSGGFGPTIGGPVAMAYIDAEYASVGSRLIAVLRNKPCPVRVTALPFVKHNYCLK